MWTGSTGSTTHSRGRSARYSDKLHGFTVTIARCYKDAYVSSFFPRTAKLWNSLPIECSPVTYDLGHFMSRITDTNNYVRSKEISYFNFFVLLFFVTLCLVVAGQSCLLSL